MSVGILLVTHPGVGPAIRASAERMLGNLPLKVVCFELTFEQTPDGRLPAASGALREADQGEGVLILSDLYGASPSNLASRLAQLGTPTERVSGLNLSMLLRALNYAEQPLAELARTAASGGRNGVVEDRA
ncbi:MAG: PTS sugar transporter subunit IIA [Lysobacteraceae bacterium]